MYNSSLFHISCRGAGEWVFWSLLGGLPENKKKNAASFLAQCGAPLQEVSQQDPIFRSEYVFVYDLREYMHVCVQCHTESMTCVDQQWS